MKIKSVTYSMPLNDCVSIDEEAELRIDVVDTGAGEYLVINASNVAIDSLSELDEIHARLREMLEACEK